MHKACGNQKEIADFLSRPAAGRYPMRWKLALLESLRGNRGHDIEAVEAGIRGVKPTEDEITYTAAFLTCIIDSKR